jgi:hypothetical protein
MKGAVTLDALVNGLGANSVEELPIGVQMVLHQIVATHARILRCQELSLNTERAIEIQGYDNQVRTSESELRRMLKSVGLLEGKVKPKKKDINDYFNKEPNDKRIKEPKTKRAL